MWVSHPMTATTFFGATLPRFLADHPDSLRLDAVYSFRISGPEGGHWVVDLHEPPGVLGFSGNTLTGPTPIDTWDCEIRVTDHDFELLASDPAACKELFYQQRIQVTGSVMLASQLPEILTVVNSSNGAGGLAQLLYPMSPREFLSDYWPGQGLVVHGSVERISSLEAMPALGSVDALLDVWPSQVRLSSEFQGRLATASEARECYRQGCSLSFDMAERFIPGLSTWLRRLQWELSSRPM